MVPAPGSLSGAVSLWDQVRRGVAVRAVAIEAGDTEAVAEGPAGDTEAVAEGPAGDTDAVVRGEGTGEDPAGVGDRDT